MGNSKDSERKQKMQELWKWAYRLRSIVLALPVAAAAVVLALHNLARLPAEVGINIQPDGQYAQMIGKGVAVMGPLALTAVCLLMVFCSKKVLYPWLISLFSLALPLLIYITNIFPG